MSFLNLQKKFTAISIKKLNLFQDKFDYDINLETQVADE